MAAALVAVGITPLRDRLQRGVDRCVYGAGRDPLEAVTRVSGTVAAEGDALAGVLTAVADAVRAPWAAVVAVDGRPVAVARPDRGYGAGEADVVAGGREAIPLLLEGHRIGELQVGHRVAAIADIVPAARRGTAYEIFAAGLGAATLFGGLLPSTLYDYSISAMIIAVAGIQAVALALFVATDRPATRPVRPSLL